MAGGVFSLAALAAAILRPHPWQAADEVHGAQRLTPALACSAAMALEATCWDEEAKEWEGVLLTTSVISLSCAVSLPHNSATT